MPLLQLITRMMNPAATTTKRRVTTTKRRVTTTKRRVTTTTKKRVTTTTKKRVTTTTKKIVTTTTTRAPTTTSTTTLVTDKTYPLYLMADNGLTYNNMYFYTNGTYYDPLDGGVTVSVRVVNSPQVYNDVLTSNQNKQHYYLNTSGQPLVVSYTLSNSNVVSNSLLLPNNGIVRIVDPSPIYIGRLTFAVNGTTTTTTTEAPVINPTDINYPTIGMDGLLPAGGSVKGPANGSASRSYQFSTISPYTLFVTELNPVPTNALTTLIGNFYYNNGGQSLSVTLEYGTSQTKTVIVPNNTYLLIEKTYFPASKLAVVVSIVPTTTTTAIPTTTTTTLALPTIATHNLVDAQGNSFPAGNTLIQKSNNLYYYPLNGGPVVNVTPNVLIVNQASQTFTVQNNVTYFILNKYINPTVLRDPYGMFNSGNGRTVQPNVAMLWDSDQQGDLSAHFM